jgi:hypothetical protein
MNPDDQELAEQVESLESEVDRSRVPGAITLAAAALLAILAAVILALT